MITNESPWDWHYHKRDTLRNEWIEGVHRTKKPLFTLKGLNTPLTIGNTIHWAFACRIIVFRFWNDSISTVHRVIQSKQICGLLIPKRSLTNHMHPFWSPQSNTVSFTKRILEHNPLFSNLDLCFIIQSNCKKWSGLLQAAFSILRAWWLADDYHQRDGVQSIWNETQLNQIWKHNYWNTRFELSDTQFLSLLLR